MKRRDDDRREEGGGHPAKRKRVQAGLSLDRFANAKASKFDKGAQLERLRELKMRRVGRFRKLRHKLEASGAFVGPVAKDNVRHGIACLLPPLPACLLMHAALKYPHHVHLVGRWRSWTSWRAACQQQQQRGRRAGRV